MRRLAAVLALAALAACRDPDAPPAPDTTPPAVVSRTPAAGDENAFAADGIRVVFSEPLDPATVSADHIRVLRGAQPVPSALSLSGDRRVVSIAPVVPVVPDALSVELSAGITDAAGNAFLGDAVPWTFSFPRWVRLGEPMPGDGPNPTPSVVIDGRGRIVVGQGNLAPGLVRYDGGAWETLWSPYLFIADRVFADGHGSFRVAHGAGAPRISSWADTGYSEETIPESTGHVWDLYWLPRDPDPYLVWDECRPDGAGGCAAVPMVAWARDPVTGWEKLDEEPGPAYEPDAAVGPNGEAYAVWSSGTAVKVASIGAEGFGLLPDPWSDPGVCGPSVAVGPDGLPVVALDDLRVGLRVLRWNGVDAWTQLGETLGTGARPGYVWTDLALEADGAPVVAWAVNAGATYDGPRQLFLARWTGLAWEQHGPLNADPDHDVYDVAIALDAAGAPVVVWPEHTGESRGDSGGGSYRVHRFHAARLNRPPPTGYEPLPVETYDPDAGGAR